MGSITAFSLSTSRLTITFLVVVVLAGLQLFLIFPRNEDPTIVIREAVVYTSFPGMTPEQVEELITRRVEEQIRTMPEIDEITSDSKTGVSIIHAVLRDEYDNLQEIFNRIRNKMDDVRPELPEGTVGPFVNDEFGLTAVATVALWSDGFSMAEMRLVARDIRDRLYELNGIRKVELYGVEEEQVFLEYSNAKLAQFGIDVTDIAATLRSQNVILPGGTYDVEQQELIINPSGNFQSIEDIKNVVLRIPGSEQVIPITEVMTVRRGYRDPPSQLAYYNNRQSIVISVSIVPGVNSVEFGERLTRKLEELESGLPIGYVLDYATFQPDLVKAAVNGALSNVYQTIVVVAIVVILFLKLRAGLIVGGFVPLAMLLGLVCMYIAGIELERVSIISAIVALGMLVDNAIVLTEDIRARLEMGVERREACLASGKSLAIPLLTSTLTTVLAFTPMLLIDGQTGEYAFSLPAVVAILLLGSWFLSVYATPSLCYWFLKVKPVEPTTEGGAADPYGGRFYRIYRGFLETALRGRFIVIGLVVLTLIGAGTVAQSLVREFFGPSERNQFLVYLDMPAGSRTQATAEVTRRLAAWLSDEESNPEVTSSIAYVGTGGPRFFLSLSPFDPDPHLAFLVVNTATNEDTPVLVERVRQFAAEQIPEAAVRVKRMWLGSAEPGYTEFRLIGLDYDYLYEKGQELQQALADMEGIDYAKLDWENRILRIEVKIDQVRARRVGVTSDAVANSLAAYTDGRQVTDYREGDLAIPVLARSVAEERELLADLWNINVYAAETGELIPLSQIANIEGVWRYYRIKRRDQERAVIIEARHRTLKAPQLFEAALPALEGLELAPGHRWEIGGEIEDSQETNEKLFRFLPQCIVGIVILLIWQFNSFRRPAIIMLTIPLAFAGALVGLLVMRAPFDFFAILGLLSLAGVIINNGIVLIDRIDGLRKDGYSSYDAVVGAAVSRMRPILMSATTTLLGVMPLILLRDPLFFAMACVIAFGLALGTLLTLVVVPVLYSIFFWVKPGESEPGRGESDQGEPSPGEPNQPAPAPA